MTTAEGVSPARQAGELVTDEPEVLTWMACIAAYRRNVAHTPRRHWWREYVTETYRAAEHAWWLHREAVAIGYATEEREFAAAHPRPLLRDFMRHLSVPRSSS